MKPKIYSNNRIYILAKWYYQSQTLAAIQNISLPVPENLRQTMQAIDLFRLLASWKSSQRVPSGQNFWPDQATFGNSKTDQWNLIIGQNHK